MMMMIGKTKGNSRSGKCANIFRMTKFTHVRDDDDRRHQTMQQQQQQQQAVQ